MNLRETYNTIAEAWHKDHLSDTWWIAGTDCFASLFGNGDSILDVGCGDGMKAKYLTKKGLVVTGIDYAEHMIEIAEREVPSAAFFVHDLYNLDAMYGEYNGVFAQAVLLHVPKRDVQMIMDKLVTKVRSGGYLYLAVKEQASGQREEVMVTEDEYGYPYERFFSFFTLPELQEFVKKSGLKTIYSDVTAIGSTKWIQIIAKKHDKQKREVILWRAL